MDIIGVGDPVKLKIDVPGNGQKCLGLKTYNRTGTVKLIAKDPDFVQVENNQPSSPSAYRRIHLSLVGNPVVPVAPVHIAPAAILKNNLNLALSELDATIVKCERTDGLLTKAKDIQINITSRAKNPTAIKKIQLIDSVKATLNIKLAALNEDRDTGNRLKAKYNERDVFGDIASISYTTLTDSIRQHIAELNAFIQSVKTNGEESRYLPGIITDIVAGGKRSNTKRSNTKRSTNKRKNRRTLKANARR